MRVLTTVSLIALAGMSAAVAFVWLGVYNVAADDPHWGATDRMLDAARSRSIATRAVSLPLHISVTGRGLQAAGAGSSGSASRK